jgi:hypothetical protein
MPKARHADQKRVTAGQDRHQGIFNHAVLAEDDGGDRFLRRADLSGHLFGRADDHVFQFFDTISSSHHLTPSPQTVSLKSQLSSLDPTAPIPASCCHEPHAKLMRRPCIR